MAKIQDADIILPDFHYGQRLIASELKKRNYICAHRGWRKSSFAIRLTVEHLLKGENVGWFAPTFNTIVAANWVDFRRVNGSESWFVKSESTWGIPGKGTCYFFSVDRPGTVRGATFSLGICEEMGEWADGVFESFVQPIVKKVDGTIVAIGTPNVYNPYNDFYQRVLSAKDYPDTHTSYIIPAHGADIINGVLTEGVSPYYKYCSKELPFPTFQDLVDDYNQSTDKLKWRVEYLCQFLNSAGAQFDGISEVCTIDPVVVHG